MLSLSHFNQISSYISTASSFHFTAILSKGLVMNLSFTLS